MNQIALPLPAAAADLRAAEPTAFDATGFEIGWDHARVRLTPPPSQLLAGHPVRQGWEAGRAAGMVTVAAAYGFCGASSPPEAWGADYLIESPLELLALLPR